MVRKNRTDTQTVITVCLALAATTVLIVQAFAWRDSESGRLHAQFESDLQKQNQKSALVIEGKLVDLYKGLRTISRLPAVRTISADGKNLDAGGRQTIQELYNDLADTLNVSEIYIVPKQIDPDGADKAYREPITTFDELIVGKTGGKKEEHAEIEEVEIYEYREMRLQCAQFRKIYGDKVVPETLQIPFSSSPEVITCDNTKFDPNKPNDKDRSGLVLSVPYFASDGTYRGIVSAVILSSRLANLLTSEKDILANESNSLVVRRSQEPNSQGVRSAEELVTSKRTLDFNDLSGKWELISAASLPELRNGQAAMAVSSQFVLRASIAGILGACMIFGALMESRWRHRQQETKADLHRLVTEQTQELSQLVQDLEESNAEQAAQGDELERFAALLQARQSELEKAVDDAEIKTSLYAHASKRFESLFNGLPVGCATIDTNGDVMEWNSTMSDIAKCKAPDALLQPLIHAFNGVDECALAHSISQALVSGEASSFESEWVRESEQQTFVQVSVFPMRQNAAAVVGAIICVVDTTAAALSAHATALSEAKLRAFIDHAPVPFAIFDTQFNYQAVSREWCRVHSLDSADLIGSKYTEIFRDAPEMWTHAFARAMDGVPVSSVEDRFMLKDGSIQWIRWECSPWYGNDGLLGGVAVITEDVSERHLALEQLFEAHEQVSSILESINDSFLSLDNDDMIVYINQSACNALNLRKAATISCNFSDVCPKSILDSLQTWCDQARKSGVRQDYQDRYGDSWLEFRIYPSSSGISIFFQDITERKRIESQVDELLIQMNDVNVALESNQLELESANRHLQALATTDGLTGINNHRYFQEFLSDHLEIAQREGTELAVILMDVDKFKLFNDEYGHQAGDSVLKGVAECLKDVVSAPHLAARYGGEEFVVVGVGLDQVEALRLAEIIRETIEANEWEYRQVTASFGVSVLSSKSDKNKDLIERADQALYKSKTDGRNRSTVFGSWEEAA